MSEPKTSFESEWRARFDRFASRGGSDALISGWSEHGLARRLAVIRAAVGQRQDRPRFLDLGCGSGVYCLLLRDLGCSVVGTDYSGGMLSRARKIIGDEPVDLAVGDVLALPFADASFSGLINVGVLQHIERGREALAEMSRVLEVDGDAYLVTLNRRSFHAAASFLLGVLRSLKRGRLRPKRHAVRRSVSDLARLGAAADLQVQRVRGVYLYPRGLRFLESLLDRLDGLRLPGARAPLFLPFANAMALEMRKRKRD